jgi:DNA-binding response OmpR family regulator
MRALVVEDEPRIAGDVAAALKAAGFVPEIVGNGEDAWFRGDTEDYTLIVLDLGLPRMDGLAVLKRWRAAGRQMPVLVLTARGAWAEGSKGSTPAPTTICPSLSAWRNWSRGRARWCAARPGSARR